MLFSLLTVCSLFLVGCLETTQEVTINEDGSGTASYSSDLSAVVAMIKQMGSGEDLKELNQVIDSTISLDKMTDSVPDLTDEQKAVMKNGVMQVKMDMKNEQFVTRMNFAFRNLSEISICDQLSGRVVGEALKGQAAMGGGTEGGAAPKLSGFDDYFKTEYTNGKIERTLIKEKYENVGEDEMLSSMKQGAAMGMGMKANYIINLPRPASKAEGKGITISADKKKITINVDMDDFFDEPSKFEFLIEY